MPENQAPSTVNNDVRSIQGIIARWHEDTNGSVASTGSANAYLFAAKQTLTAYYDGLTVTFDANFTNTAAATLDVDSVSADAIVWPDGTTLSGGEIVSTAKITVRHDGTNWQLVAGGTKLLLQTEQATTSGTTVDFTGIGSHAKRITIMLDGVRADGTSNFMIQIGDSGGFETTGYLTRASTNTGDTGFTTGYGLTALRTATTTLTGVLTLVLMDVANNTWIISGNLNQEVANVNVASCSGSKSLSAVLTQIRLTTVSADTFDLGAYNILVE